MRSSAALCIAIGAVTLSGPSCSKDATEPLNPSVDLTSSTNVVRLDRDSVRLQWLSKGVDACSASGAWSGSRPTQGVAVEYPKDVGHLVFRLQCSAQARVVSDSVLVEGWQPIAVKPTSYSNFKDTPLTQTLVPNNSPTRAYGDFFQKGTLALFTAYMQYDPSKPQAEAVGASYDFWTWSGKEWTKDNSVLPQPAGTCIMPRQALVADFNDDRKPDVFLACTGYDAPPFPGETNQILLSGPDGTYSVRRAFDAVGYWHGGAAGDVDRDGRVDVVLADGKAVSIWKGDGNGKFTFYRVLTELPEKAPYYSVQVTDVDEDGILDILAGGVGYTGCAGCLVAATTIVLLGSADGSYRPVVIPAVPDEGVVLDFAVTGTGASRALWVNRTSGGPTRNTYLSRTIQRVSWPALASTVPYAVAGEYPLGWLATLTIGGALYIGSDDLREKFTPIRVP